MWRDETVFCIASGPSSKGMDLSGLRGRPVIVVNDNYVRCPWAPILYFCDWKWWRWHEDRPAFKAFAGLKVTLDTRVVERDPTIKWLRNADSGAYGDDGRNGLSLELGSVKTGRNSGYQAMNLAIQLGAKRLVLIGYDMKLGPNGEEHWFGQHKDLEGRAVPTTAGCVSRWPANFATMVPQLEALGVEVVNASPETAIDCFPRADLADCL